MMHPQIYALARMLEDGEALMSPEDYFRIKTETAMDFTRWSAAEPGRFFTDFGPIKVVVERRIPEGLLLPGDGGGRPLFGVPVSFPIEGAPAEWPRDWAVLLSDYQHYIKRGNL